ncbi:hypothetical protein NDU88_004203 [Pleurodeles waltl]|uniref:Uncharacterized protein n=1 Tax=Pleurodeles waltl TaxID=8319 RepID=A0AAV7TRY2_PLEWA|nr:hypothetical protein NDU88_004203 [Pleurodeles waltl]
MCDRSLRRLLPYPSNQETSKIPKVHCRKTPLPICSSTVRPKISAKNFFQMHGGSSRPLEETANIRLSLSRRLAHKGLQLSRGTAAFPMDSTTATKTWSSSQSSEINSNTCSEVALLRGHCRYQARKGVSFGGTTVIDSPKVQTTAGKTSSHCKNNSFSTGLDGVLYPSGSQCSSPYETITGKSRGSVVSTEGRLGKQSPAVSSHPTIPQVVVFAQQSLGGDSVPTTTSISNHRNRCVTARMGGAHGTSSSPRRVVTERESLSHQPAGTSRSPPCAQSLPSLSENGNSPSSDRQRGHYVLREQTRRHQVQNFIQRGPDNLALASSQEPVASGNSPARHPECSSGCPQSGNKREPRMGTTRRRRSFHFRTLGYPFYRPIRNPRKQKMQKLRLQILPSRDTGECPMDKLVRGISLRLSTASPDSGSSPEAVQCSDQNDPNCSGVATPVVVPRPSSPVTQTTHQTTISPGPSHEVQRADISSQPLIIEFGSMAPELVQYGHLNLPQDCMEILREAKRPSTRSAYASKWKRFCIWCLHNNIDPVSCGEQSILPYLLSLAKSGLQLSSIKVHLAAITAYRKSPSQTSFFRIPIIKDFLEGLKKVFPPIRKPSPPWELNVVLSRLMLPPFEPIHKASLQHLTWKAAFLVAITSARRVSEIQALCAQEPYTVFHSAKVAPSAGTCEEMAESSGVPTAGGPVDKGGKKFDHHLQVPFLQEDGPDGGVVAAVEPVDSEEEEAEEEDIDNRDSVIQQYYPVTHR